MQARILVVDDDPATCEWLREHLERRGHDVSWRLGPSDALGLLQEQDFEVVIVDMDLGGESGMGLCRRIREIRPTTQVVMITGFASMAAAIEAIQSGAKDFITKPVDMPTLDHAISRSLQLRPEERTTRLTASAPALESIVGEPGGPRRVSLDVEKVPNAELPIGSGMHPSLAERGRGEPGTDLGQGALGALLGTSAAMQPVYELIRRVAASDTTVLITGESGTGKELVARALHEHGKNTGGRFVAINCAAVPPELLESELFGHARGAFTDAKSDRAGLFGRASRGTLLLDEIGEMPLEMQPKLLRVLQERQVRAVGSNVSLPMTARIVAATNLDLEEEMIAKRFREDLFYRLNVVPIHIPPLRERGDDVLRLAEHFVLRFARRAGVVARGIAPAARRKLLDYDWPGNVRELENAMERAIALTVNEDIQLEDLPVRVQECAPGASAEWPLGFEPLLTWNQIERQQILRALRRASSNKTQAAKNLGIDRRTLYRKLEGYGRSCGVDGGVCRRPGQKD
jgi:DNA-binding NtrC family response regulator